MTYTRKTAPVLPVVDLAVLKEHVRIDPDTNDDDTALGIYHDAAVQWVEEYTGRSLATQTWQLSLCGFPERLWLPRAVPLASVTFVKYYDTANALQTLSSSIYSVPSFSEPAYLTRVYAQTWPSVYSRDDAVQIEYITGATSAALIPLPLRQAVQLLAGHFYADREGGAEFPEIVKSLCAPFRQSLLHPQWEAA